MGKWWWKWYGIRYIQFTDCVRLPSSGATISPSCIMQYIICFMRLGCWYVDRMFFGRWERSSLVALYF